MKPVIGVVPRYKKLEGDTNIVFISETVRRTLQKRGAKVELIMPVQDINNIDTKTEDFKEFSLEEQKDIDEIMSKCDGLLIPGGSKSTPYDRYLLEKAIEMKIPVLGICLGMQVMSFYDEEIELNDIEDNNHYQESDDELSHKVRINTNSKLYEILGKEEIEVNSFHKRRVLGNHIYKTVATSPDGVIEAIEYPTKTFNLGVQWHPEISYNFDDNSKLIIDTFINEAKKYKDSKEKELLEIK